jgi:hypothetical protein
MGPRAQKIVMDIGCSRGILYRPMLFLLVMEVLRALFHKVDEWALL